MSSLCAAPFRIPGVFRSQLLMIILFLFIVSVMLCFAIYIILRSIQARYPSFFCSHSFWRWSTFKKQFLSASTPNQKTLTSEVVNTTKIVGCGLFGSLTLMQMATNGPMRVYNEDRQWTFNWHRDASWSITWWYRRHFRERSRDGATTALTQW